MFCKLFPRTTLSKIWQQFITNGNELLPYFGCKSAHGDFNNRVCIIKVPFTYKMSLKLYNCYLSSKFQGFKYFAQCFLYEVLRAQKLNNLTCILNLQFTQV